MSTPQHNDYDLGCVRWYGDRSPARNRTWRGRWKAVPRTLREMSGRPSMLDQHRCLICHPYTDTEATLLLTQRDLVETPQEQHR